MKYSKKLVFVILLVSIFFQSCSKPDKKESSTSLATDSFSSIDTFLIKRIHPKLQAYIDFINQLDSSDVQSSGLAFDKFKVEFTGQSYGLCDSGFVIFKTLYDTLQVKLNEKLLNDTTNFETLLNEKTPNEANNNYSKLLITNGFKLNSDEGMLYIEQDKDFIPRNFYPYLSESMKVYLKEIRLENIEGFALDGAIILSPKKHVERLIWYEKFIYENPTFNYIDNCKNYRKAYLTYIMSGYENTKLYQDNESKVLADYFKIAYEYLLVKYPGSETAKLISPYYEAIKQNQTATVNDIYKQYMIKGLIMNMK